MRCAPSPYLLKLATADGREPQVVLEQLRGNVYDTLLPKHKPIMVTLVRDVVSQDWLHLSGIAHASLRYSVLNRNNQTYFDAIHGCQAVSILAWNICDWIFYARAMPRAYAFELWFSLLQHTALLMGQLSQLIVHKITDKVVKVYVRDTKERLCNWVRSGMGTDTLTSSQH